MKIREISEKQKIQYDKLVTHVMQSWQWGEFRKSMGLKVLRYGIYENGKIKKAFQLTLHPIPFISQNVGYLPRGFFPDKKLAEALQQIGRENNCAFIKIEPNVIANKAKQYPDKEFHESPKPLFSKYNFILDLIKSEDELLKQMHPKTRYNIKVAQKHGVKVEERTDEKALKIYLKLYFETTRRQGFAGHNESYHRTVWKILKNAGMARLIIATYKKEPLTAWMLLTFKDTLYYTYGGSSTKHKEVMSNNLVCWEAIKLGKKLCLKTFDMWGALGSNPDPKEFWIGFHNFKKGYGGDLVEYIGTYDYILNWPIYMVFTLLDKLMPLKVFLLKFLRK